RLAPLGDVAGDLGEADQFAVVVVDRVDDDVRPEDRTVLADAPALSLEFSCLGGNGECAIGDFECAVFLGVKLREMTTDDLRRAIALDALGARVPARNNAV